MIRVGIIGCGNCASALVQGVGYYRESTGDNIPGVMFADIGGYKIQDIAFVAAWDVDFHKVGRDLSTAIFAPPNCGRKFFEPELSGVIVKRGKTLDGIAPHMADYHDKIRFTEAVTIEEPTLDNIVADLINKKVDVLLNYLPVGSQQATEFYMEAALKAKVAVVNCIPIFIASDPVWANRFAEAGIPIIGDDMRSQVGASVVSQVLQELAFDRGCTVNFHQQINVGGNTDFANMMDNTRIKTKKISKENVIRAQNDLRGIDAAPDSLYAGPSNFIPYLKDNKVAYIRMELEGFGAAPIEIDCKLSVQDSENSAGVVIDAIRYVQTARDLGISGALHGPSAWTQKSPGEQLRYADALNECTELANGRLTDKTRPQVSGYLNLSPTDMSEPRQTFDIDGVIFIRKDIPGIRPHPDDFIITGRSYDEVIETQEMLLLKGIRNTVFYNQVKYENKTRELSGLHKVKIIKDLLRVGYNIVAHYDDDPIQVGIMKANLDIPIILISHDLTEKENMRQGDRA